MASNHAIQIGAHILLFFLVFGMSATVDIGEMRKQLKNRKAILIGIVMQFIISPFVGFCVVKILNLDTATGVSLLVVTSSPGGSYSNWWCSIFNASLALSVTMTGVSTLLSVFFLPLNLVIYTSGTYSNNVVKALDWFSLFLSLIVVIGGILAGVLSSAFYNSTRFSLRANQLGNLAGVSLVIFSAVVSSSSNDFSLWSQDAAFYIGVALPALLGVSIATLLSSRCKLEKPERVSVAVEACYQNTGIATSVAASMFTGEQLAKAVGVPLYYGIVEAVTLAIFCMTCWKIGWTKAPPQENVCVMIATSYEVEQARQESPNAIEVVHSDIQKEEGIDDLVFSQTVEGYQVDENSLHERPNAVLNSSGAVNNETAAGDVVTSSSKVGGLSSLKARVTGYRQGEQNPDTPDASLPRMDEDSSPADGGEMT
jgi:predicted Na+-dependent transporter